MNYIEMKNQLSNVLSITLGEINALTENLKNIDETDDEYITTLERIKEVQDIRQRALDDLTALVSMGEPGWKKVVKRIGQWFEGIDPNTIIKWMWIAFVIKLIASYEKSDEPIIFRSKAMSIFTKAI